MRTSVRGTEYKCRSRTDILTSGDGRVLSTGKDTEGVGTEVITLSKIREEVKGLFDQEISVAVTYLGLEDVGRNNF